MTSPPDEPDDPYGFDPGRVAAELLRVLIRQGRRTNSLIERRVAPALERIAAALERGPVPPLGAASGPGEGRTDVNDLRARLGASQSANDPDAVITIRDELARHLAVEALADLDREVVRWLIRLIQRRMRAGTVRADVVTLAGRVADRFGATVEGASLRASLPTLRRSAGLCPRCGEPFTGVEDACPRCLAAEAAASAPAPPPAEAPGPADDPRGAT